MIGTIRGYSEEGCCIFCGKEKEGLDVSFEDGSFDGFLCLADLKRALRMRRNGNGRRDEAEAVERS